MWFLGTPCAALLPRPEVPTAPRSCGETLLEIEIAASQEISTNWKMMTEKEKQPLRFAVHEKNELLIPLQFAEILEFINLKLLFN